MRWQYLENKWIDQKILEFKNEPIKVAFLNTIQYRLWTTT